MGKKRQADKVIEAFGGVRATARALGRSPSSISKWRNPGYRTVSYGKVPNNLKLKILEIAKREKLKLTARDLGL